MAQLAAGEVRSRQSEPEARATGHLVVQPSWLHTCRLSSILRRGLRPQTEGEACSVEIPISTRPAKLPSVPSVVEKEIQTTVTEKNGEEE